MLAWQEWTFPVGNVLNEGANERLSRIDNSNRDEWEVTP